MKTNIRTYISFFWEDFDVNKFTKLLSIDPTETYKKWDKSIKNPKSPLKKETCWNFSTKTIETYYLEESLWIIVNKFESRIDVINNFVKDNNLDVKIFIIPIIENNITPSLYFNKKILNFIHSIWAEIDMDTYINP